ncbi:MAG: serine protease [Proteobacteria bacterium]|nr:MAG: serine protease [Pseudomonadota bacterium]
MKLSFSRTLLTAALVIPMLLIGCGKTTEDSSAKIVGGSIATQDIYQSYFKSVVSIQLNGGHFCGGTLIGKNEVLTAAHCFASYSADTLKNKVEIVIGTPIMVTRSGAEVFKVSKYRIHPKYKSGQNQYDIAILTLNGNSKVTPTPFNTKSDFPAIGATTYVVGWGYTKEGGFTSASLKYAPLKIVSNRDCSNAYGSQIYDGNICAYAEATDACQSDSGGPLFSYDGKKMTLVGVVSYGYGCARRGVPGVYTRVSKFASGDAW